MLALVQALANYKKQQLVTRTLQLKTQLWFLTQMFYSMLC